MPRLIRPARGEPKTRLRQVSLYTPLRLRMLDEIRRTPGVSHRELARRLGRSEGRIHDNVRPLLQARLVHRFVEPGRVGLWPNGVKAVPCVRAQSVVTERVFAYLSQHGEATMRDLTQEIGLTRHQVGRALGALERAGSVTVIRRATIARLGGTG